MKQNTKLRVCFYGTYDNTYTSNQMILIGLRENNVDVVEVNAHIKVTSLNKKSEMTWVAMLSRVLRKYRLLPTTLKNWKAIKNCDVIYVGYPGHFDVIPAWLVAKILGKKIVFNPLLIFYTGFTEEQGILSKNSLMGKLARLGEGTIYKIVDMVFADTPYQETFFKKVFHIPQSHIRVLPIGADSGFYAHTPYTNDKKKLTVTYYGLYSPIHGVEHLIEAATLLKDDEDIQFEMVGVPGNTFQKNYDEAKKRELTNITWHHEALEKDHPQLIQKADVFLGFLAKHPSVDRIIPNKIYQGLALGRVVLTADAPVIRSIFTHKENMYVVTPADPSALAKALVELKNNPSLRKKLAENAYNLYRREFTPKAVGTKLVSFMKELV